MTGKNKKRLLCCMIAVLIILILFSFFLIFKKTRSQPETESVAETELETVQENAIPETLDSADFTESEKSTEPAPEYPAVMLELPEINRQDSLMIVEAELANYTGSLQVETLREDYSGSGYLSAFQDGDSIRAAFMIPASQHYDITISVCADSPATNALLLNQQKIGEFTITEQEHFVRVTFPGIYLPAGQADLSIQAIDGNISLDYFEISNHTELYALSYQKQDALSDPQASENTKKLMHYLQQNYGKKIISGQYVTSDQNTELDFIYHLTGKYPAIRFCDLYANQSIAACEKWASDGGIVGMIWQWNVEDSGFSLADAMPSGSIDEDGTSVHYQIDAAMLTEAEISRNLENNAISESCAMILRDIDKAANALKPLAEKEIPVLWRPLHEAGGGWFWWGADGAQAYRWLWDVLYRRLTEYHGLHNLIWIWNGQNENYLVNENQYDIASMDIYLDPEQDFGSRYEQFLSLYRMTKGRKILALSECSAVPNINFMFRDHAIWSFSGLWYGNYLPTENDIGSQEFINFYCSEKTITRSDIQKIFE